MSQMLEVIDDNDVVVGLRSRADIHKEGLLHREVHVWLKTPDGKLIAQKRGPNKDTYPNLYDASVGGHVEPGQSYMDAALMEVREETGLQVAPSDLMEVIKVRIEQKDKASATHNLTLRMVYLLEQPKRVSDLQVEATDGGGFGEFELNDLSARRQETAGNMVPGLFNEAYQAVWPKLKELL